MERKIPISRKLSSVSELAEKEENISEELNEDSLVEAPMDTPNHKLHPVEVTRYGDLIVMENGNRHLELEWVGKEGSGGDESGQGLELASITIHTIKHGHQNTEGNRESSMYNLSRISQSRMGMEESKASVPDEDPSSYFTNTFSSLDQNNTYTTTETNNSSIKGGMLQEILHVNMNLPPGDNKSIASLEPPPSLPFSSAPSTIIYVNEKGPLGDDDSNPQICIWASDASAFDSFYSLPESHKIKIFQMAENERNNHKAKDNDDTQTSTPLALPPTTNNIEAHKRETEFDEENIHMNTEAPVIPPALQSSPKVEDKKTQEVNGINSNAASRSSFSQCLIIIAFFIIIVVFIVVAAIIFKIFAS